MQQICDDLVAEHLDLDRMLDGLDESTWRLDTPSDGWAVRDQVSHLWFFDQRALMALTDPAAFAADMEYLLANGGTDLSVEPGRSMSGRELLDNWRRDRVRLVDVARTVDPSARVPWYGPAMAARSFITARLMETWAHGQDVVDALGAERKPSDRLRHVAHIGVRARAFSYVVNQLPLPDVDVAVSLRSPSGELWNWGTSTVDLVEGDALDFCLAVTQRRHVADTGLRITGAAAAEWMSIAQAFAGGAGTGRQPGQFRS